MNASPQRKKPVSDLSRQPLAQLFLRKLVGGYVLLGVLIFGVQLIAEYRTHRQRLVADLHTMATTFGPGAAAALWDFQESSLQSMVSGIGLQSDVVASSASAWLTDPPPIPHASRGQRYQRRRAAVARSPVRG